MSRKLQEENEKWVWKSTHKKQNIFLQKQNYLTSIQTKTKLISTQNIPSKELTDVLGTDDREIKKRIIQARRRIGCLNGMLWTPEIGKRQEYHVYETY